VGNAPTLIDVISATPSLKKRRQNISLKQPMDVDDDDDSQIARRIHLLSRRQEASRLDGPIFFHLVPNTENKRNP
jgi:hypothetical protein